ncbi:Hypothetical_protein [Hexamita inflata]|uniref:Hypothetical_protein n=1 Tax=Hexamita inflata TaxID=28002 RepID=A0AA86PCG0_9EUKA|nr:Hypothetical protein HINF_LOCUS22886 [Hexamita inflata]
MGKMLLQFSHQCVDYILYIDYSAFSIQKGVNSLTRGKMDIKFQRYIKFLNIATIIENDRNGNINSELNIIQEQYNLGRRGPSRIGMAKGQIGLHEAAVTPLYACTRIVSQAAEERRLRLMSIQFYLVISYYLVIQLVINHSLTTSSVNPVFSSCSRVNFRF